MASRVPRHFPFIDATLNYHIPRCSCKWQGSAYSPDNLGYQQAMEAALHHAERGDYFNVSRLSSEPQYAFEVDE